MYLKNCIELIHYVIQQIHRPSIKFLLLLGTFTRAKNAEYACSQTLVKSICTYWRSSWKKMLRIYQYHSRCHFNSGRQDIWSKIPLTEGAVVWLKVAKSGGIFIVNYTQCLIFGHYCAKWIIDGVTYLYIF